MVDSSVPLNESDEDIISFIEDKKNIVLLINSDLDTVVTEEMIKEKLTGSNQKIIKISALREEGLDAFEEAIKDLFFHGEISYNDEIVITSMRHKEALQESLNSIYMVEDSIEAGMSEDFYSVDLMNAYA